jgi:hypothetical protein
MIPVKKRLFIALTLPVTDPTNNLLSVVLTASSPWVRPEGEDPPDAPLLNLKVVSAI